MTKKKRTPKDSPPAPSVEYYKVGSGMTERTRYRITNLSSPEGYAAYQAHAFRPGENEFEMKIAPIEAAAKRILERAGLLTDPNAWHASPGNVGSLMALAEVRGFPLRERVDLEWYAVEILINIRIVRMFIAKGKAAEAAGFGVAVGELAREARDKSLFEPDALLGQGDRQTRRRGGKTTGQRTREAAAERNAGILIENERLLPKHPKVRERAAIIAGKTKKPLETIRGILKRSK